MQTTHPKILLVEDESSIADNILVALQREGFEVCHEKTAQAGLRTAQSTHFDLAILDVGLPDESGYSLCSKLRVIKDIPVVFLTARSEEVDKIVGFEVGADDYLTKPFSPRELVVRIRAILRRAQGRVSATTEASVSTPFQVSNDKMLIKFFDKHLELSRYEFKLLELFIRRPGFVFTREKLMELVWDDPHMSLDRTVDTHIKSLRAKLREIRPDVQAIATHRGSGYSLNDDWES